MILSVSSWAIEAADAGLTGFGTFQVYPKDLRTLPRHPDPAVSWHSGFRGGAHARPKKTPVHHAARRRGGGMAARGARAATSEAADCRIHRLECFGLESMDCQFCAAIACTRLDRRPHHRDRVSLVGGTSRAQRRDRWAARGMPRRLSGWVAQREPRPWAGRSR